MRWCAFIDKIKSIFRINLKEIIYLEDHCVGMKRSHIS